MAARGVTSPRRMRCHASGWAASAATPLVVALTVAS